jgi:hypothetical protein
MGLEALIDHMAKSDRDKNATSVEYGSGPHVLQQCDGF